ncbi:hypothetical protein [Sphingomonas psychrolutea]|uniref:hypothetical protein n=1 Tax=Sphingomonas psychrolutea TaxID=1259676 RepID=UPI00166541A8|nr:hypothetical protein [Sphingomonas psychrolutea]
MQTALKAAVICVIALIGVVSVPIAVISAQDWGTPIPVLATAIGGLLLVALVFLARGKRLQRSAYTGNASSARWLAEARSSVGKEQARQPAPIYVSLLLVITPVLQYACLTSLASSRITVEPAAICAVIGLVGMFGVAIWNLRQTRSDPLYELTSPPLRLVGLGLAVFALIAFEALIKHNLLATILAFLVVDLLFMRLLIVCGRRLTRRLR